MKKKFLLIETENVLFQWSFFIINFFFINFFFQILMDNYRATTLMRYINTIGQIVRNYLAATGGLVTFFVPWNEAFERIPEAIERRLLRDRIWLEQVIILIQNKIFRF